MPPRRNVSSTGPATARSTPRVGQQQKIAFNSSSRISKPGKTLTGKEKPASPAKQKALSDSLHNIELPTPAPTSPPVHEEILEQQVEVAIEAIPDPVEEEAKKLPKKKLEVYWEKKVKARKAPRVHQETLSLEDKILRDFDMDSRFGPAQGKPRMARWKRAQKLGLRPPIEVLAALFREEKADHARNRRAYVDELMLGGSIET